MTWSRRTGGVQGWMPAGCGCVQNGLGQAQLCAHGACGRGGCTALRPWQAAGPHPVAVHARQHSVACRREAAPAGQANWGRPWLAAARAPGSLPLCKGIGQRSYPPCAHVAALSVQGGLPRPHPEATNLQRRRASRWRVTAPSAARSSPGSARPAAPACTCRAEQAGTGAEAALSGWGRQHCRARHWCAPQHRQPRNRARQCIGSAVPVLHAACAVLWPCISWRLPRQQLLVIASPQLDAVRRAGDEGPVRLMHPNLQPASARQAK